VQELVRSELQQNPVLEEVGHSSCPAQEVILPDLILQKVGAQYVVTINDRATAQLRVSEHYGPLVAQAGVPPEVRNYIRDKTDAAKGFIESLEQRRKVLLAIGRAIVEFQRDFLENQSGHIMPMALPRVAVLAESEQAAASHLLSNKYIDTPLGLFELARFFPMKTSRD